MIKRATKADLLAYRNSTAINQDFLKNVVLKGKSTSVPQTSRITGDVVDRYLTMPNEVDDYFCVFDGKNPSVPLTKVLVGCMEYLVEVGKLTPDIKNHKRYVIKQTEFDDFDMTKTEETRFDSIVKKAEDWWRFVVENPGKEVIPEKERSFGAEIAKKAEQHPVIGAYFPHEEVAGRDFYFQLPIYFEHEGVDCKCLPDEVIVSHTLKKIIVVDIKTIYETVRSVIFQQIKQYGYAFQLAFYKAGVAYKFAKLIQDGYKIECLWLFISKNLNNFNPEAIPCTANMIEWETHGGSIDSGRTYNNINFTLEAQYEHRGLKTALSIYKEALEKKSKTFNIQATRSLTAGDSEQLFFT